MRGATRKLQVFVSSTYTDMLEERQAAVQAILEAGHIPAGMELFASGGETQLETIYRWMDDCDVYLLILGGRYGTIEPRSKKSYTELEFDYAVDKGKSLFSIVISDDGLEAKTKIHGRKVTEKDSSESWNLFREKALLKSSDFYSDVKDIKIGILKSLTEKSRDKSLIGYVRADSLAELDYYSKNIALNAKVADLPFPINKAMSIPNVPELPSMSDELQITIFQTHMSGYGGEEISISGTWSDFFPFFCDGLSVATNDWNNEWYFSIQHETSCSGFANEVLAAIQGYTAPNTALRRSDFRRLIAYYIEAGLLEDGTGSEPISEIGRRFARHAKINLPDVVSRLKITSGNLPLKDPNEIPF